MSVHMLVPEAAAPPGLRARLIAYKDLAKLEIFDVYLSVPLAWTLLSAHRAATVSALALLMLMLIYNVGYLAAACALDDVQGVRDRIDTVNYTETAHLRKRKRKPLLDRRISEAQAVRFAYACLAAALIAAALALVIAGGPVWFAPVALVLAGAAVSYSWGPKLSYFGGQEAVIVLGSAANLALMYGIVARGLTWTVVIEGLLLGLWLMQLTSFANVNDRAGDRQAGRMTTAARLSHTGAGWFTVGLYVASWALLAVGLATGALPWWIAPLQLPCLFLQARALHAGIARDNALAARLWGLRTYRVGWLGLAVANLILVRWS